MTESARIPTLTSARLELRRHDAADLDAAAAMWAHDEVVRFIGGRRFTREEVWHRILRYVGHWELLGFGYWAIIERESGRFVGEMGFADWKRPQLADFPGVPECGWALVPDVHGKGYATEALGVALDWADAQLRWPFTICIIDEGNVASNRLAERVGYRRVAVRSGEFRVFRRDAPAR